MTVMDHFRKALKSAIKRGDTTITAVAKAAGCSRQHIYDLLAGKTDITMQLADKIAGECGFKISIQKNQKISA